MVGVSESVCFIHVCARVGISIRKGIECENLKLDLVCVFVKEC